MKNALLVILSSPSGREDWEPVMPQDVPAWVKDPDNMARLLRGEACMKCDDGPKGSLWYRAERVQ